MHDMSVQQLHSTAGLQGTEKIAIQNGTSNVVTITATTKPSIERGASWSYGETKILLALWGQDMVQRQLTNSKRTRHVWERIAERIRENGYERTADQVRTRVFNMLAEYRRILKNPTPERKKKCIFFDALHRIYQAKDACGIESALLNYCDYNNNEQYNCEPLDFANNDENGDLNPEDNSDTDERSEIFAYTVSPSGYNNAHSNDTASNDGSLYGHSDELSMPQPKRRRFADNSLRASADVYHRNHSQHHYPSGNNGASGAAPNGIPLDNSASTLLIDRMFQHLSRETEVMQEWVNLERERLAQEIARRKEEKEREERRERAFLDILTKLSDQVFTLSKQQQLVSGSLASRCQCSSHSGHSSPRPSNGSLSAEPTNDQQTDKFSSSQQ